MEWEAWMRMLDAAGHQTGHLYRKPLLRGRQHIRFSSPSPHSAIAIPPSTSAYGMVVAFRYIAINAFYRADIQVDDSRSATLSAHDQLKREQEKLRWLSKLMEEKYGNQISDYIRNIIQDKPKNCTILTYFSKE